MPVGSAARLPLNLDYKRGGELGEVPLDEPRTRPANVNGLPLGLDYSVLTDIDVTNCATRGSLNGPTAGSIVMQNSGSSVSVTIRNGSGTPVP